MSKTYDLKKIGAWSEVVLLGLILCLNVIMLGRGAVGDYCRKVLLEHNPMFGPGTYLYEDALSMRPLEACRTAWEWRDDLDYGGESPP